MYVCLCVCLFMWEREREHACLYMYVCMYVCLCVGACLSACVCACMRVYVVTTCYCNVSQSAFHLLVFNRTTTVLSTLI